MWSSWLNNHPKGGKAWLLASLSTLLLCSCGGITASSQQDGDTIAFKYAQRLSVVRYDGYTVASLKNPWKEGMTLHQYILIPEGQPLPSHLPEGTVIRTPVRRAVMFTTVHCGMLMEFGKQDCISGVADLKYVKIPWIQQQVGQGRITDVGDGMNPVIEKIIDQHPDALFLSPFENSGGYGKLDEIDIPIIECAEYMEPSPLARAEWIRFYGMLFGCEKKADSLFQATDSSYHALKELTSSCADTTYRSNHHSSFLIPHSSFNPTVLVDKMTGSVWYVPGGRSSIGQMLTDAGAHYPWADDEHSGSVSLPFETVLEKSGEADVWLFRYSGNHPMTYRQLAAEHHGYSQFRAFRQRRVYGCNVEQSTFYEETPFHPDWLLSDFIHILHPEIEGLPPLRYYHRLED